MSSVGSLTHRKSVSTIGRMCKGVWSCTDCTVPWANFVIYDSGHILNIKLTWQGKTRTHYVSQWMLRPLSQETAGRADQVQERCMLMIQTVQWAWPSTHPSQAAWPLFWITLSAFNKLLFYSKHPSTRCGPVSHIAHCFVLVFSKLLSSTILCVFNQPKESNFPFRDQCRSLHLQVSGTYKHSDAFAAKLFKVHLTKHAKYINLAQKERSHSCGMAF